MMVINLILFCNFCNEYKVTFYKVSCYGLRLSVLKLNKEITYLLTYLFDERCCRYLVTPIQYTCTIQAVAARWAAIA